MHFALVHSICVLLQEAISHVDWKNMQICYLSLQHLKCDIPLEVHTCDLLLFLLFLFPSRSAHSPTNPILLSPLHQQTMVPLCKLWITFFWTSNPDYKEVPHLYFNPELMPGLKLRLGTSLQSLESWFAQNENPEIAKRCCWILAAHGRGMQGASEAIRCPPLIHSLLSGATLSQPARDS